MPAPSFKTIAKRHLEAAGQHVEHLDGHLLVVHHFEVGFVRALLGEKSEALEQVRLAEEHAGCDRYRETLSDPVFVREYDLARARIYAALGRS